jgi:hypothetical protein
MDSLGVLQTVGWVLAIVGLAISIYTAVTGQWVPFPGRLRPQNVPATARGRRLYAFAGIGFFVALGIEESFMTRHVTGPAALLVFLPVFALLIASMALVLMAWRTTR